jgi:hypothetical protein
MAESKAVAPSWRAVLPIHPIADLLPLLSPAERLALGRDIAAHGLRNPVSLLREADQLQLIDGRNRLDAAEAAGVPVVDAEGNLLLPHTVEPADGFDVAAFVMS